MERKEIIDRARALFLQVKHEGNPKGWPVIKDEIEFQENGEDLSIEVACEPHTHFEDPLYAKEELDFELVSTAVQELERKGIPPVGEAYRQDIQVIKSETGEYFRFFVLLKHFDKTSREPVL
jgi:hypothetical protein